MSTRRTFVYTSQGQPLDEPYEVGEGFSNVTKTTGDLLKFELETVRGHNGERFSSAGQFSRYLSKNGLALHSDTEKHVAKLQEKRADVFKGGSGFDKKRRTEAVVSAFNALRDGYGKKLK